jgi:hypothetical protein
MSTPEVLKAEVGTLHRNIHDGRVAELILREDGGIALKWKDRNEVRVEPVTISRFFADWMPVRGQRSPLREEEMRRIAQAADHALRALEQNEPFRYWDMAGVAMEAPYDQGLISTIVNYLRGRSEATR